ncbi:hypothetical protein XENOCAPTIV_000021 [Xenoophorus captivus]|uniref:Uncharacterized protein n=1 Tax=Xenoophorus captivus TaxID=1517983 RepID=A0ABV0R5W1_9TELE
MKLNDIFSAFSLFRRCFTHSVESFVVASKQLYDYSKQNSRLCVTRAINEIESGSMLLRDNFRAVHMSAVIQLEIYGHTICHRVNGGTVLHSRSDSASPEQI